MKLSRMMTLASLVVVLHQNPAAYSDEPVATRRVRFRYAAEMRQVPADARHAVLWLPFPPETPHQEISNIVVRSNGPTSTHREGEYGNACLSLECDDPVARPPRVELEFDLVRREHRHPLVALPKKADSDSPVRVERRCFEPDRLVPIDGRILELALDVTRGRTERLEQARSIYDYTVSSLKYDKTGTGWGRGDIFHACDVRRGNCTDFHALFIGLCRARGIAARFEIGFSLPTDKPEGEIAGYHCWAECHVPGVGWIPVDASEARKNPERREYFFGAHDANRVTFSVGRDIQLAPAQQGERLNFFIYPHAEVDGRPHESIDRSFHYQNLEAQ
jgi:transglutaminase-like putative cysteine protease